MGEDTADVSLSRARAKKSGNLSACATAPNAATCP
jgi:hypothetical protein